MFGYLMGRLIAFVFRLSGESPFLGETTAHTYCNVEKAKWNFCEEFTDNGISAEAKDFISKLLIFEKEYQFLHLKICIRTENLILRYYIDSC